MAAESSLLKLEFTSKPSIQPVSVGTTAGTDSSIRFLLSVPAVQPPATQTAEEGQRR